VGEPLETGDLMNRSIQKVVPVLLVVAVGGGALFACGGSPPPVVEEPPPPPPPPQPVHLSGDRDVHGVIGPAGGSIALTGGLRIEIPEGALAEDVTFDVDVGTEANVWSREEGEVESGLLYDLRPAVAATEGHFFTISVPARAAPQGFESADVKLGMEEERPSRAFTDVIQTRWQYLRAERRGDRYVAEVAYFGGHRLQFGLVRD
jgi:hypothetical protein